MGEQRLVHQAPGGVLDEWQLPSRRIA